MLKKILFILISFLSSLQTIYCWEFGNKSGELIDLSLVKEEELKQCETIFIEAFNEAYREFSAELLGVKDKLLFLQEAFSDVYEDFHQGTQCLVVAKKYGEVIGFVGFKETEVPDQIYISQLAVHPDYWQHGVGRELVFSVFHLFENVNHLVVIPRKINIRAREFYFKLGFTICPYMHPGYNPEKYIGYEWIK